MDRVSIELKKRRWISLGEREMLMEHEPYGSVSTAFSSSRKLSQDFLGFEQNTSEIVF